MRRVLLLLLPLALLSPVVPATAASSAASSVASSVVLDGVRVRLGPATTQVITVNHTRGHHARISLWVKDGRWKRVLLSRDARTGYGGLVAGTQRRQGSGTTPLGTYSLPFTFGSGARGALWDLPYRRFDRNDWWVEDNASRYYNRWRSQEDGGFRWWLPLANVNGSERLAAFPTQYEFGIVIAYNYYQRVRYRGAAIFLHVNGRGATAGCVSAPRWFLRQLLIRLDPAARPLIAIGR